MKREPRVRWLLAAALTVAVGCRPRPETPAAGSPADPASAASGATREKPAANLSGANVYATHCAVCHMADGRGVPNMQPSLVGSPYVRGGAQPLANVIRGGSAVLALDRPNPVANDMPPFGYLSPEEVDALVQYLQTTFGDPNQPK